MLGAPGTTFPRHQPARHLGTRGDPGRRKAVGESEGRVGIGHTTNPEKLDLRGVRPRRRILEGRSPAHELVVVGEPVAIVVVARIRHALGRCPGGKVKRDHLALTRRPAGHSARNPAGGIVVVRGGGRVGQHQGSAFSGRFFGPR